MGTELERDSASWKNNETRSGRVTDGFGSIGNGNAALSINGIMATYGTIYRDEEEQGKREIDNSDGQKVVDDHLVHVKHWSGIRSILDDRQAINSKG